MRGRKLSMPCNYLLADDKLRWRIDRIDSKQPIIGVEMKDGKALLRRIAAHNRLGCPGR